MTEGQLQELSELAISAALSAGELINSYRDVDLKVFKKGKGGGLASEVVTEVDIKAQAIIEARLKPACKKYAIAFLGEESDDDGSRFTKDYFWSIDPLDGTLPFCEKQAGYSVSIALVRADGVPMIGVVYDPLSNTLYHAVTGRGLFIRYEKIESIESSRQLTCYLDRSYLNDPVYEPLIKLLEDYAASKNYSGVQIIAHGGAALNACWVLEHAPAVYFKLPKDKGGSLWDYAATAALFSELNLPACDIYGNPFDLNRKETTYMNHRGILFSSDNELADFIIKIIGEL